MKLLEAVDNLSADNTRNINDIRTAFELRLDWLQDREPAGYGMTYDSWCEKVEDLEEIIDCINELCETNDMDERKEMCENIQELVDTYQAVHGGLSRLTL